MKVTSTSSSTATVVPRGSVVADPSGAMVPWLTTSSPPRRMIFWVSMRLLAPRATVPSETRAPAAGDSSAAAELSGARTLTAPRTLRAVTSEWARSIWASPSRSASAARNSALTSHESRSSAIRSRTRKVQMPSEGLRGPVRSGGWEWWAQRGLRRGLDVELAVDLGADEGAAQQLDPDPDLAEAVRAVRRPVAAGRPAAAPGGTTRRTCAVTVSGPLPAVVARARHQAPSPAGGGGVVPSTEVVCDLARSKPSALCVGAAVTLVKPWLVSRSMSTSRRRSLSETLYAASAAESCCGPSHEA